MGTHLATWIVVNYPNGARFTTMSRNCIEFGSSNTQKKGVSLFGFPNDAKMKRAWTVEVHRTRDQWEGAF